MSKNIRLFAAICAATLSQAVLISSSYAQQAAQQAAPETAPESAPKVQPIEKPVKQIEPLPLWELGVSASTLSQQAYPGSELNINRVLLIPYFLYRGENFRVDRGGTGYRAIKTPTFEFDLGGAISFGSGSDKVTARAGLDPLGTFVEIGPRFRWNINEPTANGKWRFELPVRGVFDLNHHLDYRGTTMEPEINFERRAYGGWRYSTALSAVLGNRYMAETFYQVTPAQTTPSRPAYQAKQGLIMWRLASFVSHPYSNRLRVFAGVRIDSVNGAANEASSLVRKKTGVSGLLGFTYTWMQSDQKEFD